MKDLRAIAKKALGKMKVIVMVKSPQGKKSREEDVMVTESVAELLGEQLEKQFHMTAVRGEGSEDGTSLIFELNPISKLQTKNLY